MLQHHIGAARAWELTLTGDTISGETAYQWGLANRVVDGDKLVQVAAELVRRVTRHDPEVVAAQKRLHAQWLNLSYEQAVERSVDALLSAFHAGRPQRVARDRLRERKQPGDETRAPGDENQEGTRRRDH